ncbi:MAG: purine-binding chemotaxis protein CheW [Chloroflexia bacterium]|nr:purine-binding chemotaxis protein CheW [Chloroflexia bacterium]
MTRGKSVKTGPASLEADLSSDEAVAGGLPQACQPADEPPGEEDSLLSQTGGVVLVFEVAGQAYGLPVGHVIRIIDMVEITRLPAAPPIVVGVIDFAGRVIPVVDMRQRLQRPLRPYSLGTPLIVAWLNGRTLALIVDRVSGVEELRPENVDVPSEIFTADMILQARHLVGVARREQDLLLVLDPDSFLSSKEAERLAFLLSSS